MVLVGPAVGQERANAKSLIAAGAAVYENDPLRLAEVVRRTMGKSGRLTQMHTAAVAIARPDAAHLVAERVLGLLG